MSEIVRFPNRHGQPGYFTLAELPQRASIAAQSFSPGWWELAQIWRLYAGQFNVVTGIAGHGKSTFVLNVVINMAREYGLRSYLYVPENESHLREKLHGIWMAGHADFKYPGTNEEGCFKRFCAEECFIQSAIPATFDEPAHTLHWVLNQAIVAIEHDKVDLLVIDPWNELERAKPRDQLLTDYIGECLMYLKQFCRAYGVIVILIAHPTKAGVAQGATPGLADIEGSMNWYNKCDNGLIVVRDPEKSTARVISAKVREHGAGKRGVCHFFVDEQTGRFTPQQGGVSL